MHTKIIVLCGGPFSFKALQVLALEKYIVGIAIGGNDKVAQHVLEKECASKGLPFFAAHRYSLPMLTQWVASIDPDMVYSIGFPYKLSQDLLKLPKIRFINFHTGPLPTYRGPMPMFEVLKSRESKTCLSVHLMDASLDTGPLVFQEFLELAPEETYGSLSYKMADRVALAAINMAEMATYGSTIPSTPQNETDALYFPRPRVADTTIRWQNMQACEIKALANACNPWNGGADTLVQSHPMKIISCQVIDIEHTMAPGTILAFEKGAQPVVACIENKTLQLQIVQCDHGIVDAAQLHYLGIASGQQFVT